MELTDYARFRALEICVRALVELHRDDERIAAALEMAKAEVMNPLRAVHHELGATAAFAQLAADTDEHLLRLTDGLVGRAPSAAA